jgi:hypothetical protein
MTRQGNPYIPLVPIHTLDRLISSWAGTGGATCRERREASAAEIVGKARRDGCGGRGKCRGTQLRSVLLGAMTEWSPLFPFAPEGNAAKEASFI